MKKELWIALLVIGLAAAFVAVSLAVYLTRGHPWFIKKKLRVGAMLLMLTGAANTGCFGESTCYVRALPNEMILTTEDGQPLEGEITLDLRMDRTLRGRIWFRNADIFEFVVVDAQNHEVQREDIFAADGAFDEDSEEFEIEIRGDLASGDFRLDLFAYEKLAASYILHIGNG